MLTSAEGRNVGKRGVDKAIQRYKQGTLPLKSQEWGKEEVQRRIDALQGQRLPCLKRLIRAVDCREFQGSQIDVIREALKKQFGYSPRENQVRVVCRLVFGVGDTILVAHTSFGKSMTFQAYSIFTRRAVLQIIPLSRLGAQQAEYMAKELGASAALVTSNTKHKNPMLFEEIRRGKYNHVLLGPEQAVSPEFKRALRGSEFGSRLGMVVIDECHVLSDWGVFRESYAELQHLRLLLPSRVVYYGCTATLSAEQEKDVIKYAGFREEGVRPGMLKIIRLSCDRPEIKIIIRPILKGKKTDYTQIFAALQGCMKRRGAATTQPSIRRVFTGAGIVKRVDGADRPEDPDDWEPSPSLIPKTIIFVDGTNKIQTVATILRGWLVKLGYTIEEACRLVKAYSSRTTIFDQTKIIEEFQKACSAISILVCTTAVGMGMNLGCVKFIFQWDLPRGLSISDLF